MTANHNKPFSEEDKAAFVEADRLRDEGDYHGALPILEQLLARYPNKISVVVVTAHVNWEIGNIEKAISLFKVATIIDPSFEKASLGLFHCLWEIGKQEEALEEMKRFMGVSYSEDYTNILREINKTST